MKYIHFQLVVLHAALISGLGPGGRGRGFGGRASVDDRKPGSGGKGAAPFSGGFGGPGGPSADVFPSCAVSNLQVLLEKRSTDHI
jgi:hypothetical protein